MRYRIPLLLAAALALSMLTSCKFLTGRTKHNAIPNGATGQTIEKGEKPLVAFPNEKGELEIGEYELQRGDLIRRPKTQAEVVEALESSGAKFAKPVVPQETITFTPVEKEQIGEWREEHPEAVEKILRVMAGKGQLNAADQAILNQYVKQ